MKLHFLGADRQVTGSRYVLEAGGLRIMIDCGLVQERPFLSRNWDPPPINPASLDLLLLTHAHLDHTGLLPRLVKQGFNKPVLATSASADLTRIVVQDAARIQEEDARFKSLRHQREGRTPPRPVQPLYNTHDAERALMLLKSVAYDKPVPLNDRVTVTWRDAGHILGSAMLQIEVREDGGRRVIVFSGDLGQWDKPIIRDPTLLDQADYVVMESTYGDRDHDLAGPIEEQLAQVVSDAVAAGGNLLIPTFAIERAQELLFYLSRLVRANRIPHLMVFLDSPMAVEATEVFRRHREALDEQARAMLDGPDNPFRFPGLQLVSEVAQSKAINRIRGACIIMAGSGMCTAGRIKHHLEHNLSDPRATVLFVGYQAQETLGRQILDGQKLVRLHGQMLPVRARVAQVSGMSAHADRKALLRWIGNFKTPPKRVFLTHGEEQTALNLAEHLQGQMGLNVRVPEYGEAAELD